MHNPKWPGLLKEKTRHNRFVWYVRVGQGPRVRLKAEAGTPEFRQEYEAAYAALVKGEKPQAKPKGRRPARSHGCGSSIASRRPGEASSSRPGGAGRTS